MSTNLNATPYRRGRRTLYKGVMMRSRTEARFAAALDSALIKWDYEPFALAGPSGQWLPDFELHLDPRRRSFVDVKPRGTDVVAGIERWHNIATEALPDEDVRVYGAGYEGAEVWIQKSLLGAVGDADRSWGWRTTGVQIEAIVWDASRGVALDCMLSRGPVSTHLAVFGMAGR